MVNCWCLFFGAIADLKMSLDAGVSKEVIFLPIQRFAATPCNWPVTGQMALITPDFFPMETNITSLSLPVVGVLLFFINRR
jgi:hypothetical protein